MLQIIPFEVSRHMEDLIITLKKRDAYLPTVEEMPKVGFCVYEDTAPVSFGFLRMVEGGGAILDSVASNPVIPGITRDKALDMIFEECVKTAKVLKLKSLLGYSTHKSTVERSFRHGFVQLPHACMVLNLNGKA